MPETDAVLRTNETFYAAFAAADMDAMTMVWAGDGPVSVIHPGMLPVSGREVEWANFCYFAEEHEKCEWPERQD